MLDMETSTSISEPLAPPSGPDTVRSTSLLKWGGEGSVPLSTACGGGTLTEIKSSDPQSLSDLTASLREHILEAQDMLARGDIKGAEALGKATLQLIRAVEAQSKLEESRTSDQQDGVFLARADIDAARADLLRRLDRIAARIRPQEMGGGAQ